jgi:tetratricopeptide (TPR) repeat protein
MALAAVQLSRGSPREAEKHARQAVAVAAHSDMLNTKGDTFVQLPTVVAASGQHDEAIDVYSEALALNEQKENLVAASRVLERRRSVARRSRSLAQVLVRLNVEPLRDPGDSPGGCGCMGRVAYGFAYGRAPTDHYLRLPGGGKSPGMLLGSQAK